MFNANKPDASELPSTGQLLKSTGIAAVVASALLVLVVLPAEYGVDPTGAGKLFGLTEMGRIKMQLADEAKADAAAEAAALSEAGAASVAPPVEQPQSAAPPSDQRPQAAATPTIDPPSQVWSDTTTVNLQPDESYEVKLVMQKDAKARFEWITDGPKVNYDTHGDGAGIDYHGYGKGTNVDRQEGELTAAFTGSHGWFWRNRSGKPVTITLRTAGDYSDMKQFE